MKNLLNPKALLLAALAIGIWSCEQEETAQPVALESSPSTISVKYIAENFYKELPSETLDKTEARFRAFTYEEMAEFNALRYTLNIAEGMPEAEAAKAKAMMDEINTQAYQAYGKSYAGISPEAVEALYAEANADGKYDFKNNNGRAARCAGGTWRSTKNIRVGSPFRTALTVTYMGLFNLNGTSTDCDYVFWSGRYTTRWWRASNVHGRSNAARWALSWRGSTSVPAKEPAVTSTLARLEFLVGAGRVNLYYPGANSAARFARDTRVELIPR